MKIRYILALLSITIYSCYTNPKIEGFDRELWLADMQSCENSKIELAEVLLANQEKLFGEGQAEIKALLGQPDENELYLRNQKFFYYDLTPAADSCRIQLPQRLSIRFDALDRVKEVMVIEKIE